MKQLFLSIRLQGCEPGEKGNAGSEVHCHLSSCLGALFRLEIGGVDCTVCDTLKLLHLANIPQKMTNQSSICFFKKAAHSLDFENL